ARNLKPVLLATAKDVNTEQLLAFEKILVTDAALATLAERTGSSLPGSSRPLPPQGEDKVRRSRKTGRAETTEKAHE
ncbi:MAG TPA: hypothetical protein VGK72_07125, partial [Chthoniobacterales bacterium]